MVENNTGWRLTRTGVDLWGSGDDSADTFALFEHDDGRKIELLIAFIVACDVLVDGVRPVWHDDYAGDADDMFARAVAESDDDAEIVRDWFAYPVYTQFNVIDPDAEVHIIAGWQEPEESGATVNLTHTGDYAGDALGEELTSAIGSYAVRNGYMTLYATPLDKAYETTLTKGDVVC